MSEDLRALAERVEQGVATAEEVERLDRALDSGSNDLARRCVQALAEETPSLEWRSALNEELRRIAPKAKRPWFARPIAGLALAGALAVTVFWPRATVEPSGVAQPAPSLEASLVSTHLEYVHSADLAGAGLTPHDFGVTHKALPGASPYDWVEGDLAL